MVNAYLIAFGGSLLLAGRLGDLLGYRRIFLIGLGVFTGASLLCALAQTQEMLIAARFVQGAGGALASAVTLGMIVTMFPEPREQAKAIGVYGFVASAGGSIGLLVGGMLTDAISWHWIFFVNVPIGIVTGLLALRLVESRPGIGISEGADVLGAVLVTSGLMLAVYTILGVGEHGWTSARTLILAAIAIGLVAAFVLRQARIAKPLMPLRLFQSRNVTGANIVMALLVVGMFGIFFLGALYMQLVLGYSPLEVGPRLPAGLARMGLLSLGFTDKLNMRFGPRNVLITGLAFLLVAMLLFLRTPVDGNYITDLFPTMIFFGVGAGVAFPALMMLAMSGATPADAGLASGLVNTSGQVGGAVGLALLATISTERTQTPPQRGQVDGRGAQRRIPPRVPDRRGAGGRGDRRRGDDHARREARRDGGGARRGGATRARPGGRAGLLVRRRLSDAVKGGGRTASPGWRSLQCPSFARRWNEKAPIHWVDRGPKGGGGRHCPGVRGTPFRCLLRAFPAESDLGHRFGRSAGYVPGAIPSKLSRDG